MHHTINTDNDHNAANDADDDISYVTDDNLVDGEEVSMMTDAQKCFLKLTERNLKGLFV